MVIKEIECKTLDDFVARCHAKGASVAKVCVERTGMERGEPDERGRRQVYVAADVVCSVFVPTKRSVHRSSDGVVYTYRSRDMEVIDFGKERIVGRLELEGIVVSEGEWTPRVIAVLLGP